MTFRVVVITGASDGIGAEMARQVAAKQGAGVALVLAARNREVLEAVAGACGALGAQTLVVPTDVGVQAQCVALVDAAVAKRRAAASSRCPRWWGWLALAARPGVVNTVFKHD